QKHLYAPHVSHRMVNLWRSAYRHLGWFEGWLLHGEDSPSGVTVATAGQVARCRRAWDYVGVCRSANVSFENTYLTEWMLGGNVPGPKWRRWVFGSPAPADAFVVPESLVRLRLEATPYRICLAARLKRDEVRQWRSEEQLQAVLTDACQWASKTGGGD